MKKKLLVGILSSAFILGAGTLTFAQSNGEGEGWLNFDQMQPQIEEMHPDLTKKEQKEMFDACHGEGGMMENYNSENAKNMMNQF
ncbi:hypothetical protein [Robertmurraya massiliosenegalensis]|uniref:hypothetical protein n=1 Tax=Robertmurraya massiliosenegalensis TaxID=1287657 RepID=UPI0002E2E5AC|nr:hypothetical protein [Robertmurraya massiliosenegalensis]